MELLLRSAKNENWKCSDIIWLNYPQFHFYPSLKSQRKKLPSSILKIRFYLVLSIPTLFSSTNAFSMQLKQKENPLACQDPSPSQTLFFWLKTFTGFSHQMYKWLNAAIPPVDPPRSHLVFTNHFVCNAIYTTKSVITYL